MNSTLLRSWVIERHRGDKERERAHNVRVDSGYLVFPKVSLCLESVGRAAGHLELLTAMDEGSGVVDTHNLLKLSCQLKC